MIWKQNGCSLTPIRLSRKLSKRKWIMANRCISKPNLQPISTQKIDRPAPPNGCRMDLSKRGVQGTDQTTYLTWFVTHSYPIFSTDQRVRKNPKNHPNQYPNFLPNHDQYRPKITHFFNIQKNNKLFNRHFHAIAWKSVLKMTFNGSFRVKKGIPMGGFGFEKTVIYWA